MMETLKVAWDFFQKEVLGMQWLNRLMGSIVETVGLDPSSRIGGSIQFFFYDVIKIMVLLGVLIFMISYIWFLYQLNLAWKMKLPVILHVRDAHKDVLRISDGILPESWVA